MVIDLTTEPMLGHWEVPPSIFQCEFQFGRRLIYVQYPINQSPQDYLAAAQQVVVDAWHDIDNALCFAERLSRKNMPEFWAIHDKAQKPGHRFDVYAIHFNLGAAYPLYTIGRNHDFIFEHTDYADDDLWKQDPIKYELPEPPDHFSLSIRRLGSSRFEDATEPYDSQTSTSNQPP